MKTGCWKFFLGIFFLCLCGNHALAQIIDFTKENPYRKVFVETDNFGASYLRVLEESYPKVAVDSIRFSMLNDLAYYWHTRDLWKAMAFTKKGLQFTRDKNDILWNGRFKITQGAILLRMEKLDSARIVLEAAKRQVKKEDLPFLNTQLGYVFERKGQLVNAINFAMECLRLGEELQDKKAIALAYSDLSNLFWKQAKYEKGLEYGLASTAIFAQRGINDLDYNFTLYVVGNNYLALNKYDEALQYYENAIAMGERYGFYNNLSDIYISLVDLYAYLDNFELAQVAGENAVKYAELLHNEFMVMRSWLSVGKLQYLQGKYISSIASLQKAINIATEDFGDEFYLSQAYETLGKAYAGNHNYQEAYMAFEAYDKLKNQYFTAEADEKSAQIHAQFDLANKESTILTQVSQLRKQRFQQTLASVLAVMFFLLLLTLFITYKNNIKKSKLLEKQNLEKEFLLKEIHHRVKNNLEVVSSMLSLQAEQIQDPNISGALLESENRVFSMGMIHQNLYLGKNLSTVEMKDYFMKLGTHIVHSFGMRDRVGIQYAMQPVEVNVDVAIPLGLIVNELLTNSLKYAFPKNRKGTIEVCLSQQDENTLILLVKDDGIGQPEKAIKNTGFGTMLVGLLTQQLNGTLEKNTVKGTCFTFSFQVDKANHF